MRIVEVVEHGARCALRSAGCGPFAECPGVPALPSFLRYLRLLAAMQKAESFVASGTSCEEGLSTRMESRITTNGREGR
jgi:hypothetical protein